MKIILALVLSVSFYSPSNTKDDYPSEIICEIAGRVWTTDYVFNVSNMPEDCDIFCVGQYDFDMDNSVNTHFMESDKSIIKKLTKANKIVYTLVGFTYDENWPSIFEADMESTNYHTETIDPLVIFLNAHNLSGILLNMIYFYDGITDYPKKMSTFVTKIKQSVKRDIKFGLVIPSWTYTNFSSSEYFDFSITNSVLDIYIFDFANLNMCDSDGKQYGLAPITCKNPTMLTMEQVYAAISNSSIDQSKIYALLGASVIIPEGQLINKKRVTTYSKFCSSNSTSSLNISEWCVNPSELSYQQGAYAKKHFKGIEIEALDSDDYDNSCSCGFFPVTNLFISGWKSSSLTQCAKIDKIRQS